MDVPLSVAQQAATLLRQTQTPDAIAVADQLDPPTKPVREQFAALLMAYAGQTGALTTEALAAADAMLTQFTNDVVARIPTDNRFPRPYIALQDLNAFLTGGQ